MCGGRCRVSCAATFTVLCTQEQSGAIAVWVSILPLSKQAVTSRGKTLLIREVYNDLRQYYSYQLLEACNIPQLQ